VSSAKWRLEDKVSKIGNMAKKIIGSLVYNVVWAEAYLHTKRHLDPSSHLATIDISRKEEGLLCPFWRGELGLHLTQCCLGRGLPPHQVVSWAYGSRVGWTLAQRMHTYIHAVNYYPCNDLMETMPVTPLRKPISPARSWQTDRQTDWPTNHANPS